MDHQSRQEHQNAELRDLLFHKQSRGDERVGALWGESSLLFRMMGHLEDEWGDPAALPSLEKLIMAYNAFCEQIPGAWGQNGSFPALTDLDVSSNYLTGIALYDCLSCNACRSLSPNRAADSQSANC